jgi:hypothetical protein
MGVWRVQKFCYSAKFLTLKSYGLFSILEHVKRCRFRCKPASAKMTAARIATLFLHRAILVVAVISKIQVT